MKTGKKFKIISQELYAVKSSGYELDMTAERHEDFSDWKYGDDERTVNDARDDFRDLIEAALCEDERGEMCAVEFIYSDKLEDYVPMIWQRVKKADKKG